MKKAILNLLISLLIVFLPFLIGELAELLIIADSSTGYVVSAVQIIFIVYYFKLRA